MSAPDTSDDRIAADPGLMAQALLYSHGELEGPEADAFEARLAADQTARDALCQAVQLSQTLGGMTAALPNPGYRDRVRSQLLADAAAGESIPESLTTANTWWSNLVPRYRYRGHPALWLLSGALAAVLVIRFSLEAQPPAPAAPQPVQLHASVPQAPAVAAPGAVAATVPSEPPSATTSKMADVWAELNTDDHLIRVWEQEQKRRHRVEERRVLGTEARPGHDVTH
jgi:hypothetical protein